MSLLFIMYIFEFGYSRIFHYMAMVIFGNCWYSIKNRFSSVRKLVQKYISFYFGILQNVERLFCNGEDIA